MPIGANDTMNPAARHDPGSPICGIPIITADSARLCYTIARTIDPGFAGIDNGLYHANRT